LIALGDFLARRRDTSWKLDARDGEEIEFLRRLYCFSETRMKNEDTL